MRRRCMNRGNIGYSFVGAGSDLRCTRCSDRSNFLPLRNYDRPTNQQADMRVNSEVKLLTNFFCYQLFLVFLVLCNAECCYTCAHLTFSMTQYMVRLIPCLCLHDFEWVSEPFDNGCVDILETLFCTCLQA